MIFLVDFYILDMENESSSHGSTLILGRPFLMTAKTKIDVHVGTLSMEFGDDVVHFNIFEALRHLAEEHSAFLVDIIDDAVDSVDICTNLIFYFSDFYDFDLGSFDYACDDSATVCSICVEIYSSTYFDCDAVQVLILLFLFHNLSTLLFPSTIQPLSQRALLRASEGEAHGCAFPRRKDARSRHQRLFVENVGKTEGNRSKQKF